MESLLCDEKWLMSPNADQHATKFNSNDNNIASCCYTTKEDCDEFFQICMNNEIICVHEPGYLDRLKSDHGSVNNMRYKAILWLIQSRSRLNLSIETISKAANYFDRFVSVDQSNGWKWWVIELVLVACLSIASKFAETATCSLHDIQMQGLDHSFESGLIQRMELTVLKALDWRLICTTPFSYVELMTWDIIDYHLMDRLNDLLFHTLLDCDFLVFRPSVIAVSALKCVLEELITPSTFEAHLSYFSNLIPHHQKENMTKCHKLMKERSMYNSTTSMYNYNPPSSPVTVLRMERVHISEGKVDFSLLIKPNKKRRINQEQ